MAKFDIPASPTYRFLDLNDINGLDSRSTNPDYNRASDMINIVKKDGLHRVRSNIIQTHVKFTPVVVDDDSDYDIKYVGKVEEYEGSNPVPYYIKIAEKMGEVDVVDGSSLYISVWPTPLVKNIQSPITEEGLTQYKVTYKKFNFTNYGKSGNRAGLYEHVDYDDKTWVFTPIGILSFKCSSEVVDDEIYLKFDVINVLDSPYVPTIVIGSKPDGTGFTKYEDINLLGNKRKVKFTSDGTSTLYQLPEKALESTGLKISQLNEAGLYEEVTSGFTFNNVNGTITFEDAPEVSPIDGQDNIVVEYSKKPILNAETNMFSYETVSQDKKVKVVTSISKDIYEQDPSKLEIEYSMVLTKTSSFITDSETMKSGKAIIKLGDKTIANKTLTTQQMEDIEDGESVTLTGTFRTTIPAVDSRKWSTTLDAEYTVTESVTTKTDGSAEQRTSFSTRDTAMSGYNWIGLRYSARVVPTVGTSTDGSDSYWTVYVPMQLWLGNASYLDTGTRLLSAYINGGYVSAGYTGAMNGTSTVYPGGPVEAFLKIPFSSSLNGTNINIGGKAQIDAWINGTFISEMNIPTNSSTIKLPTITLPTYTQTTTTANITQNSSGTFDETINENYSPVNYKNEVPGSARLACYYGTKCVTVYGYEADRRIFLSDGTGVDTFSGVTSDGTSSIYYFPDSNYNSLGENTEILGYAQTDGYLFTFKKGDDSVYVRYAATIDGVVQFPSSTVTKNLQVLARPIQIKNEILLITRNGIESMIYSSNECRTYLKSYFINNYFELSLDYNYDKMQWYLEDNLLHILLNNYDFVTDTTKKTTVRAGLSPDRSSGLNVYQYQYEWYVCEIPELNSTFSAPSVTVYQPKDFERKTSGSYNTSLIPVGYSTTGIYKFSWDDNKVDILLRSNSLPMNYPIKAHYITPFMDFGSINLAKTIKYVYINTRSKNGDAFYVGYINEEGVEETMEKVYSGINDYLTKMSNYNVPFPKLIQIKSKIKKFMNIKLYLQNQAEKEDVTTVEDEEVANYGDMTFDRMLIQYQLSGRYRGE